ncbi:MAG: nucleotide exchange factor GrpE [Phycisphaeraceae bacterium]|nr:nucleotide exchange factor GrpE [Phycisphaeraceae bacterium]
MNDNPTPPSEAPIPMDGHPGPQPDEAAGLEADPFQQLRTELEQAEARADDLHHRLLRVAADYQNYARRAEQNVVAARQQQLVDVARAMVPVFDHFERALEVNPQADTATVLQGVQMVRDELIRSMEAFGVQRMTAEVGELFDPNRHEALMRQPAEGVETNHVTMQLQPGYRLGEVTLRPVKVAVAP